MALRINVRGTVIDGEARHVGRVNTNRGRLSVRYGKALLFDEETTSIDRISKKKFNATLADGRIVQIETEGCGCGGGASGG